MTSSVHAIIAAHGDLAGGFVSAVQAIAGKGSMFRAMTNANMSAADVTESLRRALDETGARMIFTDLPAGSCTIAARRVQKERPGIAVETGVNLPMLLEFAFRVG
jgi:mannose/fructose-specific phosphotransferase system component IIA